MFTYIASSSKQQAFHVRYSGCIMAICLVSVPLCENIFRQTGHIVSPRWTGLCWVYVEKLENDRGHSLHFQRPPEKRAPINTDVANEKTKNSEGDDVVER